MSNLDRWEHRFAAPDYLFGTEPNAFLEREAHRLEAGQSVLAVADGEGRNGVFLAGRGLDVLSVDLSPTAQRKAEALAQARGVQLRFAQVDLETWDWPQQQFDAVVAIFIQFAMPALRDRIFAGMRQALRPGGVLLMQGYRTEQIAYGTGGPREIDQLYTRAILEAAFGGMASLDIREHDSVIREGTGHDGMSALIDLVAVK